MTTNDNDAPIYERATRIIIDHMDVNPEKVTPEARLIEDLGADSLDMVELIMAFEEVFGLEIPDSDAERLCTVTDVVAYLTAKLHPPVAQQPMSGLLTTDMVKKMVDDRFARVILGPHSAKTITGQPFVTVQTDPEHQDVSTEQAALRGLVEQLEAFCASYHGDTIHWRIPPETNVYKPETGPDEWIARCRLYIGSQSKETIVHDLVGVVFQKIAGVVQPDKAPEPLQMVPDPAVMAATALAQGTVEPILPRWRCHKVVQADKIKGAIHDGGWVVTGSIENASHPVRMLRLESGVDVVVDPNKLFARGWPMIGDYLVRYEDGYLSWSPAEAFEAGYTRLCSACDGHGRVEISRENPLGICRVCS